MPNRKLKVLEKKQEKLAENYLKLEMTLPVVVTGFFEILFQKKLEPATNVISRSKIIWVIG